MEWYVLITVLVLIWEATATVVYGDPGVEDLLTSQASVVFCSPRQTFFCMNFTHYCPCVHLPLQKTLLSTDLQESQQKCYFCGEQRCCHAGAESPCTFQCRGPLFPEQEPPPAMWNIQAIKKKKRKMVPIDSEEIARLNKIVSLKSFIIRQRDLEVSEEDNLDTTGWKPSYRTFCPMAPWQSANETITTTIRTTPTVDETTTTMITTTPIDETTTTMITTTPTTKSTTTTTTKATTTTKKTKRTHRPTRDPNRCIKNHGKVRDPLNCNNYYECIQTGKDSFIKVLRHCPEFYYFDAAYQDCYVMEVVHCIIDPD